MGTATIIDDSTTASLALSVNDVNVTEASGGTTDAVFSVSLSDASTSTVTVDYATADGTASVADPDYTATSGTLTFAPGVTSLPVTVPVPGDTRTDSAETFSLNLSNANNAPIAKGTGVGTIIDDEPVVTITATSPFASETAPSSGAFTVSRTGSTANDLTVYYHLSGTAYNGADYVTLPGYVVIPAGASNTAISIDPINDGVADGTETVVVDLESWGDYAIGNPSGDTVSITDNEPVVTVMTANPNASEAGLSAGQVTFTRAGDTSSDLTVNYSVSGTATAGVDYGALTGSVVIPAGQTSANVDIVPVEDSTGEDAAVAGDETVVLTLQPGSGYAAGTLDDQTVTIADDAPVVSITPTNPDGDQSGPTPATLTVSRTGDLSQSLTVDYQVDGNATPGVDYNTLPGYVQIPAGQSSADVVVMPNPDSVYQTGTESVILTLGDNPDYVVEAAQKKAVANLKAAKLDVAVDINQTPAANDDVTLFVPGKFTQTIKIKITNNGAAGKIDLGVTAGMGTLDNNQVNLAAGANAVVTLTPTKDSAAANDVAITASRAGVVAGKANMTIVSVTFDPTAAAANFR